MILAVTAGWAWWNQDVFWIVLACLMIGLTTVLYSWFRLGFGKACAFGFSLTFLLLGLLTYGTVRLLDRPAFLAGELTEIVRFDSAYWISHPRSRAGTWVRGTLANRRRADFKYENARGYLSPHRSPYNPDISTEEFAATVHADSATATVYQHYLGDYLLPREPTRMGLVRALDARERRDAALFLIALGYPIIIYLVVLFIRFLERLRERRKKSSP